MTRYFTLDGEAIQDGESLPNQFIHVFNGTALMWDFTEKEAKSSLVSSELLSIVLGIPVQASVSDLVTCETCGYGPCHCKEYRQPMNTLNHLRQVQDYLWLEGNELMDVALSCKLYDAQAQEVFRDGLATVRRANSLWPLIHWYRSFDTSYWALRRLKPVYVKENDPHYCWVCGEMHLAL